MLSCVNAICQILLEQSGSFLKSMFFDKIVFQKNCRHVNVESDIFTSEYLSYSELCVAISQASSYNILFGQLF